MSKAKAELHFIAESRLPPEQNERNAELSDAILRKLALPPAHDTLTRGLPWPILARLLAALFNDRIMTVDSRDWLEIQRDPKNLPGWLWAVFDQYSGSVLPVRSSSRASGRSRFGAVRPFRPAVALPGYVLAFGRWCLSFHPWPFPHARSGRRGRCSSLLSAFVLGLLAMMAGIVADVAMSAAVVSSTGDKSRIGGPTRLPSRAPRPAWSSRPRWRTDALVQRHHIRADPLDCHLGRRAVERAQHDVSGAEQPLPGDW